MPKVQLNNNANVHLLPPFSILPAQKRRESYKKGRELEQFTRTTCFESEAAVRTTFIEVEGVEAICGRSALLFQVRHSAFMPFWVLIGLNCLTSPQSKLDLIAY